jgi:hypothetical protein
MFAFDMTHSCSSFALADKGFVFLDQAALKTRQASDRPRDGEQRSYSMNRKPGKSMK